MTWQAMSARVDHRRLTAGTPYFAGALSLVFHAANPYVPTFRSDIRYFEVKTSSFICRRHHPNADITIRMQTQHCTGAVDLRWGDGGGV